ncbi:hypothetical protein TG4357_03329 [Thalassovita gelatinovora]|uniref:Uncharacterized protein n=1 Tax=Thalassovita gelatinovora TaxID=53501 RepID=A0A0P1FJ33_THAGE|nr:hypothetical protein TG4357_03329 [Thalassovita gelatinovora]SEQ27066.1 hypothetical protein SAMN04488043_104200 [Thalassovita gelatinovora]
MLTTSSVDLCCVPGDIRKYRVAVRAFEIEMIGAALKRDDFLVVHRADRADEFPMFRGVIDALLEFQNLAALGQFERCIKRSRLFEFVFFLCLPLQVLKLGYDLEIGDPHLVKLVREFSRKRFGFAIIFGADKVLKLADNINRLPRGTGPCTCRPEDGGDRRNINHAFIPAVLKIQSGNSVSFVAFCKVFP